jgi:hypothetical protein
MKTVLALALITGAVMTGTIAGTSASAQSEPSAAQLANQLDQNGVASTYVYRVGRVGGVRYGGRVGYGGRYGYGRRGLGYGRGLAAGALVGGAVAGSGYYYGNTYGAAPVYADPDQTGSVDDIAYCVQRFRSYDRASGTYLGYDGRRHPCLTVE